MTTDLPTARKALAQLISTVEGDTRYYPKAKSAIVNDLKIVSDCLNTDPLTITETVVKASQRLEELSLKGIQTMPLPILDIPTIPPYRDLAPAIKYGYCLIVNSKAGYHLREQLMATLLDKDPMKAFQALVFDRLKAKDETGTHMATYMQDIYYDPFRYDATRALGGLLRLTEHAPVLPDGMVWGRFLNPTGPWFYEDPTVLAAKAKVNNVEYESQTHDFGLFESVVGVGGAYVAGLPRSWIRPDDGRRRSSAIRAANTATVFRAYLKDGLEGAWTACEDIASGSPGLRYAINCEAPFVDPSPTVQDDWRRAMTLATKQIDTIDND